MSQWVSDSKRFLDQPLNQPLSLRANSSWAFLGNAVYSACQWGMLVVLAKLGSPQMVGQFSLGLALTTPLFLFANLQLRSIQVTDARREYRLGDYLALRLVTTGLALVASVVIGARYELETAQIILAMSLFKSFEALSDIFYGLFQQYERMDRIAKSMMIKGTLSLAALSVGIYLTHQVVWSTLGLAIVWAIVSFSYDIPSSVLIVKSREGPGEDLKPMLYPHWDVRTLCRLAWLALPLGVVMMLVSLNTNIPRYVIERLLGQEKLGLFSAMAYVMLAGSMVVNALGQSASPKLARYYASGNNHAFGVLLLKLIGIGVILGGTGILLAWVAGPTILTLLYRAEYANYPDVFVWLTVAAAGGYTASFLSYGMTAARRFRVQMPLFALVTGITALTCIWLVPISGLQGAAMALIISVLVQVVGSASVVAHAMRSPRPAESRCMQHGYPWESSQ